MKNLHKNIGKPLLLFLLAQRYNAILQYSYQKTDFNIFYLTDAELQRCILRNS